MLAACYSKKEPDIRIVKVIIAQSKIKDIKFVFLNKGVAVKNLLAANIDAFVLLIMSIKLQHNVFFTSFENFISGIFNNKYELDVRNNVFDFSEIETTWLLDLCLFDSSFTSNVNI